jgi:hypothetical protein
MDGKNIVRCENLEMRCSHTHFKIDMKNWALSNYSTKCFFWPESDKINLHEISIFFCLKYIYEYINAKT